MYHCSHFTAGSLRGRCNTNRSLLTLWGELQEAFDTVQPNGHQLVFNLGKAWLSLPHSHEQWLSLSLMEKNEWWNLGTITQHVCYSSDAGLPVCDLLQLLHSHHLFFYLWVMEYVGGLLLGLTAPAHPLCLPHPPTHLPEPLSAPRANSSPPATAGKQQPWLNFCSPRGFIPSLCKRREVFSSFEIPVSWEGACSPISPCEEGHFGPGKVAGGLQSVP